MTLEEKRTRVKEILEVINKKKASFFGISDSGEIVMEISLDVLKEIRRLLDQAQAIDPEDGPTRRKLNEMEEIYRLYLDQYMSQ
jgi:hypothetical protein